MSTPDGGRTWRPAAKPSSFETQTCLRHAENCLVLALVLPVAVSLFPLTPAMQPISNYLNGDGALGMPLEEGIASDSSGLQPLVAIFEAQPFRSRDDQGRIPANFQGIIVISRAVPKPSKVCAFQFHSVLTFKILVLKWRNSEPKIVLCAPCIFACPPLLFCIDRVRAQQSASVGVFFPGERRALLCDERNSIASNLVVVEHGYLQVRDFQGLLLTMSFFRLSDKRPKHPEVNHKPASSSRFPT